MHIKPIIKSGIVGGVFLVLGVILGYFIPHLSSVGVVSDELRLGEGTSTNPLLECAGGGRSIASQKEDFTRDLEELVHELKQDSQIVEMGVYFRDLNNGPVIGVHQNEEFVPASLLKVPLMIAYLRWADDDPTILDARIPYMAAFEVGTDPMFAPETPLVEGVAYSARSLLEAMIGHSDNNAAILLYEQLPERYQEELYTLVGIDPELVIDPTALLSVKQYSIFFRILFNGSFLSRVYSEYALELLARSDFNQGIRAQLPKDVLVANKFGERQIDGGLQQFHDCGIVYYPGHPYLLCIMTRGSDIESLLDGIQEVSTFVYKKIDEQYH